MYKICTMYMYKYATFVQHTKLGQLGFGRNFGQFVFVGNHSYEVN